MITLGRAWVVAASILLAGAAQSTVPSWVAPLRAWLHAASSHEPGTADEAATTIAAWSSPETLATLGQVKALAKALADAQVRDAKDGQAGPVSFIGRSFSRKELEAFLELPGGSLEVSLNRLLQRGAMLHTDIATLVTVPAPVIRPTGRGRSMTTMRVQDGQVLDVEDLSAHWAYARTVLDSVTSESIQEGWVQRWYRATIAFQQAGLGWSECVPHLARARQLFPQDAHFLFYEGVMHEVFATEAVQSAVQAAVRAGLTPAVKAEPVELARAETLFSQALAIDPRFGEARLRHGRVLGLQGHHDEAVRELTASTEALNARVLEYYAALFLGREHDILGKRDDARADFERASMLYPHAQSPVLALSQLARRAGNPSVAVQILERLFEVPAEARERDDPWWIYDRVHARDAEALLAAVRGAFSTGGGR